jgi:hypothetical protein
LLDDVKDPLGSCPTLMAQESQSRAYAMRKALDN